MPPVHSRGWGGAGVRFGVLGLDLHSGGRCVRDATRQYRLHARLVLYTSLGLALITDHLVEVATEAVVGVGR